jgi:hypothetical protein
MGIQKAKYRELLGDPDVQRWHRNLARGSRVTADVYLRRLGWFCEGHGLTPRGIAAMGQKELEDLLLDSVSELEEQGKAGSYIESIVKARPCSYDGCCQGGAEQGRPPILHVHGRGGMRISEGVPRVKFFFFLCAGPSVLPVFLSHSR